MIEPVAADGRRYLLKMELASPFARHFELSDAKNFPRAVDASDMRYHFCNHWQGMYHVRFIEKVNQQTGELLESALIWGQPKHSMREFYDSLCIRWPELLAVGFESTFCRFLSGNRKIAGFRVTKAQDLAADEIQKRLPLTSLPALAAADPLIIAPTVARPAATGPPCKATSPLPAVTPTRSASGSASAYFTPIEASPATQRID
jgi:hypothetical protein